MLDKISLFIAQSDIAVIMLFIVASVITVISAMRLAAYGEAIAKTTKLGYSLVGLILLSAATSLPELFSSSSASFIGNVDLSFGNVLGSNMTNIFILVIMDFFVRQRPILYGASQKNIMTGGIVIFITSIVLLMIYISNLSTLSGYDFWYFSFILMIFYVGGMIIVYKYEKGNVEKIDDDHNSKSITKNQAIIGFVFSSILVFCSAILLSYSCDGISKLKISGLELGGTFVGTLFMAFTTSLPEVVVSISAIRLGRSDMALGNLFGSNLFNLAILSFSDGFYRLGRITNSELIINDVFALSHPNHIITGLISIIFIGIVLSSLMLRNKKKYGPLGVDTLSIGILYILGLYLLFILR